MIKLREAYVCNLKLLLLFLVIVGHGIEPFRTQSGCAGEVYRVIYTVHMPLFAFVSGLFLKTEAACRAQAVSALRWYMGAQGVVMLAGFFALGELISPLRPWWYLWYLLSLCWWSLLCRAALRLRKKGVPLWMILCVSVLASCLCGLLPWVNRLFSLSRTVVFLPYVLLGQAVPTDFYKKRRLWVGIALIAAFAVLYGLTAGGIADEFFWQADSSGFADWREGVLSRVLCLLYALTLGGGILCLVPTRRYFFTKVGADTMPAYLLHGVVPLAVEVVAAIDPQYIVWPVLAAALFLVVLFEFTRWGRSLYAIRQSRDRRRKNAV